MSTLNPVMNAYMTDYKGAEHYYEFCEIRSTQCSKCKIFKDNLHKRRNNK